jgi:aerobic-type carbon monoxide dehydrogenase small subunit (CoxS/CutS family)
LTFFSLGFKYVQVPTRKKSVSIWRTGIVIKGHSVIAVLPPSLTCSSVAGCVCLVRSLQMHRTTTGLIAHNSGTAPAVLGLSRLRAWRALHLRVRPGVVAPISCRLTPTIVPSSSALSLVNGRPLSTSSSIRLSAAAAVAAPTSSVPVPQAFARAKPRRALIFYLNGVRVEEPNPQPDMTLLEYIRVNRRLTGSKLGCGEGGCGACTVMVSSIDRTAATGGSGTPVVQHRAINACLAPLCSVDGAHVVTVEGIGQPIPTESSHDTHAPAADSKQQTTPPLPPKGLHPVQQRMVDLHGSQCGYCTPGIVMAAYTFFRNNPNATAAAVEEAMDGNLCRCTGYRPILDAFKSLAADSPKLSAAGSVCACGRAGGCSAGAAKSAGALQTEDIEPEITARVGDMVYPQQSVSGVVQRSCTGAKLAGAVPYAQTNAAKQEIPFPKELLTLKPVHDCAGAA